MLAREMSSPRARSMSGRLLAQSDQPTVLDGSPAAVVPAMNLTGIRAQGSMTQAVTAGQTAEARLQAATQLRNLNRSHRSTSEANLSAIANGNARPGMRSPSPEVLKAVRRGEQLVPPTTPSEVATATIVSRRGSTGSTLERVESSNTLEPPEPDVEPEPEPEPGTGPSVSFAGDEDQPDEEKGTARP